MQGPESGPREPPCLCTGAECQPQGIFLGHPENTDVPHWASHPQRRFTCGRSACRSPKPRALSKLPPERQAGAVPPPEIAPAGDSRSVENVYEPPDGLEGELSIGHVRYDGTDDLVSVGDPAAHEQSSTEDGTPAVHQSQNITAPSSR